MRVLMVGPFAWAPKGTVSSRAFLMARALAKKGHKVTILLPPYDNPKNSGFQWARDSVEIINVSVPSTGDSLSARLTVPLLMTQWARRWQPDLAHVFKPVGYSGLTALYLHTFLPKIPLVLDHDDWEGRGGWADANAFPLHRRWFFEWQERWLPGRADMITVASRVLQTRVWGLGVDPERVTYFPNGPNPLYKTQRQVSSREVQALRRTLNVGDDPLAVYVGYISYGSEVGLIVQALPKVLKAIPNLRVVIVGSGEGLPELQRLAHAARMTEHLRFTGWVDHRETPVFLAAADLALYPYRDNLINRAKSPSKITAYMAMGKPIVATAVGEIVEYLDGGHAGLLVHPTDVEAFAAGMVSLLCNVERASELGRRAEHRIWEHYDWERQVDRLEEVYWEAMAR